MRPSQPWFQTQILKYGFQTEFDLWSKCIYLFRFAQIPYNFTLYTGERGKNLKYHHFLFSSRGCVIPVKNLKSYLFGPIFKFQNQILKYGFQTEFDLWSKCIYLFRFAQIPYNFTLYTGERGKNLKYHHFLFSSRGCVIPVKNLKRYLFGPILNQHFCVFMSDKFLVGFFKANIQSFQKRLSNSWLDIFLEGAFNKDFWSHLGNDVSDRSTETNS